MVNEIPETQAGGSSNVKKQKTGGRIKKPLEQLLAETRIRDQLAEMNDDTNIPEELAAIYLCTSVSELVEYRKPVKSEKSGLRRVNKNIAVMEPDIPSPPRLKMIKVIRQGAVGQNQKVFYKLGHLREFRDLNVVESSFEAAVKAGLYGHVTIRAPFFVEPSKRSDRDRPILIGNAWDQTHPLWAVRFKELFDRILSVVWITSSEAAKCQWRNLVDHNYTARTYFNMLTSEACEVQSALDAESNVESLNPSVEEESSQPLSQTEFPQYSNDRVHPIRLFVKSADGQISGSQGGIIGIKDLLRESKFLYNPAGKKWVKSIALEGFELDSIKLESWALEAKHVEANFHDKYGALIASYEIQEGQWTVVVDRWILMKPRIY